MNILNLIQLMNIFLNYPKKNKMGILAKTLNRSKSNKKRKEDMTDFISYLNNIKWVDLGHPDVLFAKVDFTNDTQNKYEQLLTLDKIKDICDCLPPDISIMNKKQIEFLKRTCKITSPPNQNIIFCENPDYRPNFICFKVISHMDVWYYMKRDDSKGYPRIQIAKTGKDKKPTLLGTTSITYPSEEYGLHYDNHYCLKLVKKK